MIELYSVVCDSAESRNDPLFRLHVIRSYNITDAKFELRDRVLNGIKSYEENHTPLPFYNVAFTIWTYDDFTYNFSGYVRYDRENDTITEMVA